VGFISGSSFLISLHYLVLFLFQICFSIKLNVHDKFSIVSSRFEFSFNTSVTGQADGADVDYPFCAKQVNQPYSLLLFSLNTRPAFAGFWLDLPLGADWQFGSTKCFI
jgi:hypothetical protein